MVRGGYNGRYETNGAFRNFNRNGISRQTRNLNNSARIYLMKRRNRRNFAYERSRGQTTGNSLNAFVYSMNNGNPYRMGTRPTATQNGIGRTFYPRGYGNNRFRYTNRSKGIHLPIGQKVAARPGGLDEAILRSRRNVSQRTNMTRRGRGRWRGGFRRGRGGAVGNKGGPTNFSKDSLDTQLDTYMGDDAVKNRLDMDLDQYFGREQMDGKHAGDMTDFAVADIGI